MKLKEDTKFENKLVSEKELDDYLNSGWEIVQAVNDKILVRKQFDNR